MAVKYVFVTGGVVSGLGKGITAASLGRLLKARGYKVTMQKFDPYINIDPGTMNPIQHGEVFVTEDGAETDLDLGHYERFIDEVLGQLLAYLSNITSGLSMLVVGLSISRLPVKAVFQDWKMLFLTLTRLLIFPLLMIGFLRLLPINLDETLKNVLILTAALPVSSAQSMITEQYGTNTAAAGRSVFMTTLFSVITVPLIMMIAFA